jgi:type II secretory pathway pseudopilin PulG
MAILRSTRRGVSLLEVVLASVILVMVSASVVSVVTFINRGEAMRRKTVEAYEVANRLMLTYVDDEEAFNERTGTIRPGSLIEGGELRHRWLFALAEEPVQSVRDGRGEGLRQNIGDMINVRISVFAAVANPGGGERLIRGEQFAELTRLHHKYQPVGRNKDSDNRRIPALAQRALEAARRQGGGGGGGGSRPQGPAGSGGAK